MNKQKLKTYCNKKLERLNKTSKEYLDKLETELQAIEDQDYYWFYADAIKRKTKRQNKNGLLVPYLLGIVNEDPVEQNIKHRHFYTGAFPDIDCDFQNSGRPKIYKYLQEKYSKDNVCYIGTHGVLGIKSGLKDIERTLGIPCGETNALTTQIGNLETYEDIKNRPEVIEHFEKHTDSLEHLLKIIDSFRQFGTHAGGILVSSEKLREACFIALAKVKKGAVTTDTNIVSGWRESGTIRELEELGFIKFDILGLVALDQIKACLKLINPEYKEIYQVPNFNLDDKEVYENIFLKGKTTSVFQFHTPIGKKWCKELKPYSIEELADISTLIRPGSLKAKVPEAYCRRKIHGKQFSSLSQIENATKETFGLLIYQEQIMKLISLCTKGEIDFSGAEVIRRKIAKQDPDTINLFVDQCVSLGGMTRENADTVLRQIIKQGGYSFNKSHSIAYSYTSYVQAFLKYHYPLEFWTASLQTAKKDKIKTYLVAAKEDGIDIKSISIKNSEANFSMKNGSIYCGFTMAKGVGGRIHSLIEARNKLPFTDFESFWKRGKRKEFSATKTLMIPLIKAGAFLEMGYTVKSLLTWFEAGHKKLPIETDEYDREKLKKMEFKVNGINLLFEDFSKIKKKLIKAGNKPISEILEIEKKGVVPFTFFGRIDGIEKKVSANKKKYYILDVSDDTDSVTITVWDKELKKLDDIDESDTVLLTDLKKSNRGIGISYETTIFKL